MEYVEFCESQTVIGKRYGLDGTRLEAKCIIGAIQPQSGRLKSDKLRIMLEFSSAEKSRD
jgi:hypothetical protein